MKFMADPDAGAHLHIVPLASGMFAVSATVDGHVVFDATVTAAELAEACAQAGRSLMGYLAESLRSHAGQLSIGRLLGWA